MPCECLYDISHNEMVGANTSAVIIMTSELAQGIRFNLRDHNLRAVVVKLNGQSTHSMTMTIQAPGATGLVCILGEYSVPQRERYMKESFLEPRCVVLNKD